MKIWILVCASAVAGIAAGLGSVWAEFANVRNHFEPHREDPIALAEGGTQVAVLDKRELPAVIVVGGESYDFGVGQRNTELTHTFVIENVGTAPLELTIGHTTCKCTVSELDEDAIAPGDAASVTLTWKLNSMEEEFRQTAEIYTNDPLRPTVVLSVSGLVIEQVKAVPKFIVLGDVPAREGRETEFYLYGVKVEDLQVTDATFLRPETAEFYTVEFEDFPVSQLKDEPHVTSAILGRLTIKPGLPLGPIDQKIKVTTNIDGAMAEPLEISGTVVSDVSVVGASNFESRRSLLHFGTIESSQGESANLHILVKGPHRHDVKLNIEQIDPEGVLAVELGEPKTLRDGAIYMYPLKIEVPAGARPVNRLGSDQGKLGVIHIKTTHPTATELPIYVKFAVK